MFSVATQRPETVKPWTNFAFPSRIIGPAAAVLDSLALLFAMEISRRTAAGPFSDAGAYLGLGLLSGLVFLVCGRGWGFYQLQGLLAPQRLLPRLAAAAGIGAFAVVCLLFLLKTGAEYSRGSVVIFAFLSPLFVVAERTLLAGALARAVDADIIRGKRVVLIGERAELDRLTSQEIFHFGLDEVGRFALSLPAVRDELTPDDKSVVLDAIQFGRKHKAVEYALIMP